MIMFVVAVAFFLAARLTGFARGWPSPGRVRDRWRHLTRSAKESRVARVLSIAMLCGEDACKALLLGAAFAADVDGRCWVGSIVIVLLECCLVLF